MEKITKRNIYTALVNYAMGHEMAFETEEGNVEITAEQLEKFARNELEQINKKNEKAKERATKKKTEDPLMAVVYDCVSDEFECAADIAARVAEADGFDEDTATVSKVIYRLNQLCKEGKLEKTELKNNKRTYKGFKRV